MPTYARPVATRFTLGLVLLCAASYLPAAHAQDAADPLDLAVQRYIERQTGQLAQEAQSSELKLATLNLVRTGPPAESTVFGTTDAHPQSRNLFDVCSRQTVAHGIVNAVDFDEPIFACSFPSLSWQEEPATQPAEKSDAPAAEGYHKGHSEQDIADKLNNPGGDLAQLNFKWTWNRYTGNLGRKPGWGARLRSIRPHQPLRSLIGFARSFRGESASSQDSLAFQFQPVFPFKLDDQGHTLVVRPTFNLNWQPTYNAANNGFDEDFGLGDTQLVAVYAYTDPKTGFIGGVGPTMQFPTHTDDVLGNDAVWLGPAAFAGYIKNGVVLGVFPQHWWNIGGGDGYTSLTAVQFFYWFNVGDKGWQIGGDPTVTYNWAADDSDQAWAVPINLGLQRVFKIGNTPVKINWEAFYYFEQPDAFGPLWGMQLKITPVIENPIEALFANKK